MVNILVTYATRYGSTGEIANIICEELNKIELISYNSPVNSNVELSNYDGLILGSPIYGGNWLYEAESFLKHNRNKLRKIPIALFSVGMVTIKNVNNGKKEHERALERLPINHSLKNVIKVALFDGVSYRSNLPFWLRTLDFMAGTPQGDFRKWNVIRDWAKRVGQDFILHSSKKDRKIKN